MPKNYSNTFLYNKYPDYDKALFSFIMEGTEIDKEAPEFENIIYDVKRRQTTPALMKVLKSDVTKLMISNKPNPRQFKVLCAKDLKGRKKDDLKVYIDCSDIFHTTKEGTWVCDNIDAFICYLVSAMTNVIYQKQSNLFMNNSSIISSGAVAFSSLMTHIIDYVAKISSTPKEKSYCQYMCANYYVANIMEKDNSTDSIRGITKKISSLSDREADIVDMQLNGHSYDNIRFFAESLSKVLHISKLTADVIVERWMFLYGVRCVFGLELFPSFAEMLTDCYIGAYLNNQKTIEKIAGQSMVEFSKTIINIGSGVV